MATFDDVLRFVQPQVASASIPLCKRFIESSLRDFLRRSMIWRIQLDPIDVEDYRTAAAPMDEGEYDLEAAIPAAHTDKVRIIAVMVAMHNDIYMQPASEAWLDSYWPRLAPRYNYHLSIYGTREQWRVQGDSQSTLFFQPDRNSIRLMPKPEATVAGALNINVSVRPLRGVEEFDDDVQEDWAETIADGALANLYGMSQQVWSDPQLASVHAAAFLTGILEARGEQARSNARDDKTTGRVRAYD